jgi:hypothetical protein
LQSGLSVGFTYTYSCATAENITAKTDTRAMDIGYGTRCEVWIADDDVGTNSAYQTSMAYGESWLIPVGAIGKYIQARVWVVAQSGATHGYVVKGSWQGPVIE